MIPWRLATRKALLRKLYQKLYTFNICSGKGPSLVCERVVYHLKWLPLALIVALSYSMVVLGYSTLLKIFPQPLHTISMLYCIFHFSILY